MSAGPQHAALVWAARYQAAVLEAEQLREAMRSRAVIEQAKGILMARRRCSPDEAFDVLREVSQTNNTKLREVAREPAGTWFSRTMWVTAARAS
jgi:AmiR/NasT family two-component response regulator